MLPGLRLAVPGLSDALLERAVDLEISDARLAFVASPLVPRLVTASVALDVARLALSCGARALHAFLAALERSVELALSALAAQ